MKIDLTDQESILFVNVNRIFEPFLTTQLLKERMDCINSSYSVYRQI